MEKITIIDANLALNKCLHPKNTITLNKLNYNNAKQIRDNFLSLIALAPGTDTQNIITVLQYISQFEDEIERKSITKEYLLHIINGLCILNAPNVDIVKLRYMICQDNRFNNNYNIRLSDFDTVRYSPTDINIITQIFNFQIKL